MDQGLVWARRRCLVGAVDMEGLLVVDHLQAHQHYHSWISVDTRRQEVGLAQRLVPHREVVAMVLGIKEVPWRIQEQRGYPLHRQSPDSIDFLHLLTSQHPEHFRGYQRIILVEGRREAISI